MFIVIESNLLHLLDPIVDQLIQDFKESNLEGIISESEDLDIKEDGKIILVALKEPYHLVDCMNSTFKESRKFVQDTISFLHKETSHIAISLTQFKFMNSRLRPLVTHRVRLSPSVCRVLSLRNGHGIRWVPGQRNLWDLLTGKIKDLPREEIEFEESPRGKVLVTLQSKEGRREDYLVTPEVPFEIGDGRVLTLVLPDDGPELLR